MILKTCHKTFHTSVPQWAWLLTEAANYVCMKCHVSDFSGAVRLQRSTVTRQSSRLYLSLCATSCYRISHRNRSRKRAPMNRDANVCHVHTVYRIFSGIDWCCRIKQAKWYEQEAQLSQRDRSMLYVIVDTRNASMRFVWYLICCNYSFHLSLYV